MRNVAANMAIIGLTLSGLSGCVVYEKDHKADGYDEGYDDLDGEDNPLGEDETGDDIVDEEPAVVLGFYPDQAEQGESFIGYITVNEGELDLSLVEQLNFYGDIEVQDFDIRGDDEIIVSIAVSEDAITGPVDVLLELSQDGNDVVWFEAAFTVYEAGSGNSCDDADEPVDDDTTDDDPGEDPDDGGNTGDGGDDDCE